MKLPLKHIDTMGVSIVIVTYNGCHKLRTTLEHLAKQEQLGFNLELLVIDNDSTDGTGQFVIDVWNSLHTPYKLRLIRECNKGQMFARQRGIEEAHYRYILFCDDDNWLHSTYVATAFNLIGQNNQIAALGGLGIITFEHDFSVPPWMCEQYERSFGTGSQGKQDGNTTFDKGCLYTAGTIFDRIWLDHLYRFGFTTSLKGRDGNSLVGGEDTELTLALKLIGGELHYSSQLHFQHYMPKERINWAYLKQLWQGFGYSNYFVLPYREVQTNKQVSHFKKLYLAIKRMAFLYLKKNKTHLKEGNVIILEFEMAKGNLKAMLFKQAVYNKSKKMVKHLLEQTTKA